MWNKFFYIFFKGPLCWLMRWEILLCQWNFIGNFSRHGGEVRFSGGRCMKKKSENSLVIGGFGEGFSLGDIFG